MDTSSNITIYYNIFRKISSLIHSSTDVDEVLNLVVWKATEALKAKGALLRIVNTETQQLELSAVYGLSDAYISKSPISDQNFISNLYQKERIVIITDIENDARVQFPKEVLQEGVKMIMDLPLKYRRDVIGRLRIYFDTKRDFEADEIEFASSLADQCASAIDKARLIQKQRNRYDQLALHTEKLSALGRMAAGIAHEINNPLAGILLYSSNLYKKVPEQGPLKEGLEIIMQETQRCKIIIRELLDFARDKAPKKTKADIHRIIEKVLNMLKNEFRLNHITIEKHLSKELGQAFLDENQFEQVIVNLILNAVQSIDKKGKITIRTRMDTSPDEAVVVIEDNGSGIPEEHLNKIFEPFFSTKANGSGLGLAVSYGIICNHHGRIEVKSKQGRGTCFTIFLPLHVKDQKNDATYTRIH